MSNADDEPRKIAPHESLQRIPRLLGVGFFPLVAAGMMVWIAYNVIGLWTLPTAVAAILAGAFLWVVRRARRRDAFAVESFVLSVFAPRCYEAQPRAWDAPRKPEASIPPNPPK